VPDGASLKSWIFTALQKLGLKLMAGKGPVQKAG
jgi:hypothetical protein